MDDLISRTAALDAIDGMKPMQDNTDQLIMHALCWAAVKSIPVTVDAAPVVHGRWIDYKDDHQCSACKEHVFLDTYVWKAIPFKFCPNCGAKMEKD
jgi:hypothetical protein